jgi:hypothetical protein
MFEGNYGIRQREAAFGYLRAQARLMYDKTEKVSVVGAAERPQQQQWNYAAGQGQQQREQLFQVWQDLYTGDKAKVQAATDAILGLPSSQEQGLIAVERGDAGVTFKYADPNKNRTISFTDANKQAKDPRDWFKSGTEVFGNITDSDLNRFGKGTFSGADKGAASARQYTGAAAEVSPVTIFNSATAKIDSSTFGKKEGTAAEELASALSPLGIEVLPSGDNISNYVIVKLPNGVEKRIGTNAYTNSGAEEFKKELIDFLDTEMKKKPDVLNMASSASGGEGDGIFGGK